jgi:predicted protein tyrosine phosphatase
MSHIRYDGSGELHIRSIRGAIEEQTSHLDRVISVCQDSIEDNVSDEQVYSHYNMSDGRSEVEEQYGGSCEYRLFHEAADELYEALDDGESVLIHCHQGISRSVSVATAAIGRLLDISREDALDLIHTYRITHHYPDSLLVEHASDYISEYTEHTTPFEGYE